MNVLRDVVMNVVVLAVVDVLVHVQVAAVVAVVMDVEVDVVVVVVKFVKPDPKGMGNRICLLCLCDLSLVTW